MFESLLGNKKDRKSETLKGNWPEWCTYSQGLFSQHFISHKKYRNKPNWLTCLQIFVKKVFTAKLFYLGVHFFLKIRCFKNLFIFIYIAYLYLVLKIYLHRNLYFITTSSATKKYFAYLKSHCCLKNLYLFVGCSFSVLSCAWPQCIRLNVIKCCYIF